MNIKASEVRKIANDACDKYTVQTYFTSTDSLRSMICDLAGKNNQCLSVDSIPIIPANNATCNTPLVNATFL